MARMVRILAVLTLVFSSFTVARAQAGPSLVPPAFLQAKSVFLSNAGADSGLFPHPFSGDQARAYSTFYGYLQSWGRYQIVNDPSTADLVFELQLTAPNGPSSANKQNGASDPVPMFRLVIYQRRTHYVLWALTESVDPATLQKTHDHNFDLALMNLVNDLKAVDASAK